MPASGLSSSALLSSAPWTQIPVKHTGQIRVVKTVYAVASIESSLRAMKSLSPQTLTMKTCLGCSSRILQPVQAPSYRLLQAPRLRGKLSRQMMPSATKASHSNSVQPTTHAVHAVLSGAAGACSLIQAGCTLATAYCSLQLILLAREHHTANEQRHKTGDTAGNGAVSHAHQHGHDQLGSFQHMLTTSLQSWVPDGPQFLAQGAPYWLVQSAAVSLLLVAGAVKQGTTSLSRWMASTAATGPAATSSFGATDALSPTAAVQAVQAAQVLQDGRMADIEKQLTKLQLTSRLYQADLGRPLKQVQEGMAQQAALTAQLATAQEGLKNQVLDTQKLLVATQATSAKQFEVLVKALEQVQKQQAAQRKQAIQAAALLAALQQQVLPQAAQSAMQQSGSDKGGPPSAGTRGKPAGQQSGSSKIPPPDPWLHARVGSGVKASSGSRVNTSSGNGVKAGSRNSGAKDSAGTASKKSDGSRQSGDTHKSVQSVSGKGKPSLNDSSSSTNAAADATGRSKGSKATSKGEDNMEAEVQASLTAAAALATKVAAAVRQQQPQASQQLPALNGSNGSSNTGSSGASSSAALGSNVTVEGSGGSTGSTSSTPSLTDQGDKAALATLTGSSPPAAAADPGAAEAASHYDSGNKSPQNRVAEQKDVDNSSAAANMEPAAAVHQDLSQLTTAVDQRAHVVNSNGSSSVNVGILQVASVADVSNASEEAGLAGAVAGQDGPWQVLVDGVLVDAPTSPEVLSDTVSSNKQSEPESTDCQSESVHPTKQLESVSHKSQSESATETAECSGVVSLSGVVGKQYVAGNQGHSCPGPVPAASADTTDVQQADTGMQQAQGQAGAGMQPLQAQPEKQAGAGAGLQASQQAGMTVRAVQVVQPEAAAPVMAGTPSSVIAQAVQDYKQGFVPVQTQAPLQPRINISARSSNDNSTIGNSVRSSTGSSNSGSRTASGASTSRRVFTAPIAWEVVTDQGGRLMALQYSEAAV